MSDRSKISGDQTRFFIALSLYPLSFFANTPFKELIATYKSYVKELIATHKSYVKELIATYKSYVKELIATYKSYVKELIATY